VTVHRVDLVAYLHPVATLEVECSSGTYVRALARDLGEALGCGGTVRRLTRLASGSFRLGESVTLGELADAGPAWCQYLHATDDALLDLPAVIVGPDAARAVQRGQAVEAQGAEAPVARLYTAEGEFLALAEYNTASGRWQPRKVFGARSVNRR
jgi:tRNA pseudouridine55 synthase